MTIPKRPHIGGVTYALFLRDAVLISVLSLLTTLCRVASLFHRESTQNP